MKILTASTILLLVQNCGFLAGSVEDENVLENLVFVVLSQPNSYHSEIAHQTRIELRNALEKEGVKRVRILVSHEDLPIHGAWTIFPLVNYLDQKYRLQKIEWFLFLDESTRVNAKLLKDVLERYNNLASPFIGHALQDREHTIIHHFEDPKSLSYPDFEAGFILSSYLVKGLAERLEEHGDKTGSLPSDFSIDAPYEVAKVIRNQDEDPHANNAKGPLLEHEPQICIKEAGNCALFPSKKPDCNVTKAGVRDLAEHTLFAVKTCSKLHEERLPIIRDTWASVVPNIVYASEVTDKEFQTIKLDGITMNTERGHCQKTMAILKYFHRNSLRSKWKWLVIADDDTIMSVHKLMELLHCYDHEHFVGLGQRYGYRIALGSHGYDYITGGGGMVFSAIAVEKLLEKSSHCSCPRPDTPDDMHLGACMTNLGQSIVHSSRFHQARPDDYPESLLRDPVSFHKFWNVDPRKVYDEWFRKFDEPLRIQKFNKENPHQEL